VSDLDEAALEALVRHHRNLGSQIAELKGEQESIKTTIDAAVPLGWSLNVDGVPAHKRGGNRSFDMVTAISMLKPEAKEACIKTGYDAAKVRAAIEDQGDLEACMLQDLSRAAVLKLS
jgi:hypothetical protein